MSKYRLLLAISFQDAVQYRLEGAIWFLFDVLQPLMMVFVWLAAYRDTDQVAGYSLSAMLGYYLGLALLRNALTSHPEWDIAEGIRNGRLSMLLLRPIHPWGYWLVSDAAWRVFRLLLVGPLLALAVYLLGGQVQGPRLTVDSAAALLVSLPLAYALCYLLKICLGFAGFWLIEISGLAGLIDVLMYLFGASMVPLELMPLPLRLVADVLPFKYIYYYPLALALGRLSGLEMWSGLAAQAAWTLVLFLLARLLWLRGLRQFEAVGA